MSPHSATNGSAGPPSDEVPISAKAPLPAKVLPSEPPKASRFDPTYTQRVLDIVRPRANPRLREIAVSLIRHLHDFALETELTLGELMAGLGMLVAAGKKSSGGRNEVLMLCDVLLLNLLGLLEEIAHVNATEEHGQFTPSAIKGTGHRPSAPVRQPGDSIIINAPIDQEVVYMSGRVLDSLTDKPIAGAILDIWQASTNELHDMQDEQQTDFNLQGKFETDSEGKCYFYCLKPTPYLLMPGPGADISEMGPAGELMMRLDQIPIESALVHIINLWAKVEHNHKSLTTQLFDRNCKHLKDDALFTARDPLMLDFVPRCGDPKAILESSFDIRLMPI